MVFIALHLCESVSSRPVAAGQLDLHLPLASLPPLTTTVGHLRSFVARSLGLPRWQLGGFLYAGSKLTDGLDLTALPQQDSTRLNLVVFVGRRNILQLAPENLEDILRYLPSYALWPVLRVCRQWACASRACIKEVALIPKTEHLRSRLVTGSTVQRLLQRFQGLSSLDLSHCTMLDDSTLEALSAYTNPEFKRLSLSFCSQLGNLELLRHDSLEWLSISGCSGLTRIPRRGLLPSLKTLVYTPSPCYNAVCQQLNGEFAPEVLKPVLLLSVSTAHGTMVTLRNVPEDTTVKQLKLIVTPLLGIRKRGSASSVALVYRDTLLGDQERNLRSYNILDDSRLHVWFPMTSDDSADCTPNLYNHP
eukprot:RCo028376